MNGRIMKIIFLVLLGVTFLIFIIGCSTMQDILGWPKPSDSDASRVQEVADCGGIL